MIFCKHLTTIVDYVIKDYHSCPARFVIEILAWSASVTSALILSLTLPDPPWIPLYCVWVVCTALFAWSSWTRGSVGMMCNFILLNIIDTIGLVRSLMA
jgi:hypothetical protein